MVDPSFGGDGATKPLPLVDGVVVPNIGTQELRLHYGHPPFITDKSQPKYWIYQYRNGKDKDWNSFYCFPELEFTVADYHVMEYYTGAHPESFQTFTMLIVKFLKKTNEDEVYGKIMLVNGDVKLNEGGKTRVVQTCKTEEERIKALKEWFEIELTEEERCGISGRPTELKN
jgi:arylamine N-acetyltransferase